MGKIIAKTGSTYALCIYGQEKNYAFPSYKMDKSIIPKFKKTHQNNINP